MPLWSPQALRVRVQEVPWQRLVAGLLALAALVVGAAAWVLSIDAAQTEPVVLAAVAIAPGERVGPEQLTVIQVPRYRPAALTGIADPALVIGQYARVQVSANQLVTLDLVQAQPLAAHVFTNGTLPAELLTATVYELPRTGLSSLTAQDRLNILVLVDEIRGRDLTFRVGMMDRPGSGSRVVRVLRGLPVLAVNDRIAFLDVTPTQSTYLWALQTASIPFVGELAATSDGPLGPLSVAETSLADLGMDSPLPNSEHQP